MPAVRAKCRKRFNEACEVLDWKVEQQLLVGHIRNREPSANTLRTSSEWCEAWYRWRDVILPKAIEARPGLRPFAMYATGELPPRPVHELPRHQGVAVDVEHADGSVARHWLRAPAAFVKPEPDHLFDLGVVDRDEVLRHRQWVRDGKPDTYRLEVSYYY